MDESRDAESVGLLDADDAIDRAWLSMGKRRPTISRDDAAMKSLDLFNLIETSKALASANVAVATNAALGELEAARFAMSNLMLLATNLSAILGRVEDAPPLSGDEPTTKGP